MRLNNDAVTGFQACFDKNMCNLRRAVDKFCIGNVWRIITFKENGVIAGVRGKEVVVEVVGHQACTLLFLVLVVTFGRKPELVEIVPS